MTAQQFALRLAHKNMKASNYSLNWSACLSAAWQQYRELMSLREEIINKLKAGIVAFSFQKKDKSTRSAVGTLNSSLFSYESKGSKRKANKFLVKYFDLEKGAFRCFKLESFIDFNDEPEAGSEVSSEIAENITVVVDAERSLEFLRVELFNADLEESEIFTPNLQKTFFINQTEMSLTDEQLEKAFNFVGQVYNAFVF